MNILEFPGYIIFLYRTSFPNAQPKERGQIYYTFHSYLTVMVNSWISLQFLLPNLDRKMQIYWDTTMRKSIVIYTEKLLLKYTKTGVVM